MACEIGVEPSSPPTSPLESLLSRVTLPPRRFKVGSHYSESMIFSSNPSPVEAEKMRRTEVPVIPWDPAPRMALRSRSERSPLSGKEDSTLKKSLQLLPFLAGWLVLLLSAQSQTLGWVNGCLQLVLFFFVVCIPTWKTGRMSYVDIGWPWGLVLIGVVAFVLGDGDTTRIAMVSGLYVFMGGRMGYFALLLWRKGVLKREFPRYQYQAIRWQRAGETRIQLARQVEVLSQGLANASYLAFPAFVIAANPSPSIALVEVFGFVLVVGAFALETVADTQKARFLSKSKAAGERHRVCDVGLWRYSRHPNYFFEWMVWNGLILMAIPSLPHLFASESLPIAVLLTAGLFFVSRLMYQTLVHYTGARPSEYFSVQKRPGYIEYQRTTNMFFPGPRRP